MASPVGAYRPPRTPLDPGPIGPGGRVRKIPSPRGLAREGGNGGGAAFGRPPIGAFLRQAPGVEGITPPTN